MRRQKIEEAISETQKCLTKYWQKEYTYAVSKLAKEVVWIGALQIEFLSGIEAVTNELKITGMTNPCCHLLQQEFWCIQEDKKTCTIVGKYMITTDDECGEIIQEQQRATFLWEEQQGELSILHMHISSPVGYLEPNEMFPHKIGKATYRYLQEMVETYKIGERNMAVRDEKGHMHFITEAEIEYVEAKDHNTIINMVDGTVNAHILWKEFLEMLGVGFIRVHRSFVVNRKYIKRLKHNELQMVSGACIPIPAKRFRQVYNEITKELTQ